MAPGSHGRWLVCGIDERHCVVGLGVFLESRLRFCVDETGGWRTVVLCPAGSESLLADTFRARYAFDVFPYRPVPSEDRYRAKLALTHFVNAVENNDDEILYLDYDHLCRHVITLPATDYESLYLSSENVPLPERDHAFDLELEDCARLSGTHFNTSLILGRRSVLCAASAGWELAYTTRLAQFPVRYREEVAFSLAARYAGIRLNLVSPTVQGNWQQQDDACSLFHYGGESRCARIIKGLLVRVAQEPSIPIPDLGQPFAREVCDGLREFMQRSSPKPADACPHSVGVAAPPASLQSAQVGNEAIARATISGRRALGERSRRLP